MHTVEAYLPKELGGDYWKGEVEVPDGSGGGGGTPPHTGTASLQVEVGYQDSPGGFGGVTVRLSTGPTTVPDQVTDANGITVFPNLEPGEYHVNAAKEANVWRPGHVKQGSLVPGQTHSIRLREVLTGILQVKTISPGEIETGATVTVTPGNHASQRTGEDGLAYFTLLPGSYQASAVSADGEWIGSSKATVKTDQASTAIVHLVYSSDGKRTRTGGI